MIKGTEVIYRPTHALPNKNVRSRKVPRVYRNQFHSQGLDFFSRPVETAMRPVWPFMTAVTPVSLYLALIK